MKRFLLVLSVCMLTLGQVMAQSQTITGKVVSGVDGEAIPGASISVLGTSRGTITDYDGKTLQIEASVKWIYHTYSNYVTIDGVRYHESDYDYKDDFSDLTIEAWLDGEPVSVDEIYIENNLLLN